MFVHAYWNCSIQSRLWTSMHFSLVPVKGSFTVFKFFLKQNSVVYVNVLIIDTVHD